MTQTMENSFHSTNQDMGSDHEEVHKNQHTNMVKGEPLIETLTPNRKTDDSYDLMIKMANRQGVLTEEAWKKYNASIRKVRRNPNYRAYLKTLCSRQVNGIKTKFNNTNTPQPKRTRYAQELASIEKNGGVPIDGSLYYLSNINHYDKYRKKGGSDYENYRRFEQVTFESFYHSNEFRTLHPGCFRFEIHFDELGTMHAQEQSVWFHADKKGRMQYSKRAEMEKALVNYYGSKKELNRHLDALCYAHGHQTSRKIGEKRLDANYNDLVADTSKELPRPSTAERRGRIEELWRIESLNVLCDVAEKTATKYNVDWKRATTYQSDGKHRTRDAYVTQQQQLSQQRQVVDTQLMNQQKKAKANEQQLQQLTQQVKSMTQKASNANRNYWRQQQRLNHVNKQLDQLYEQTTGKSTDGTMDGLEMVHVIKHSAEQAKDEKESLTADNQRLKQENQKLQKANNLTWQKLRLLIVNIIQVLMPLLRRLDHKHIKGQDWRDAVTEHVDKTMRKVPLLQSKQPKNNNKDLKL